MNTPCTTRESAEPLVMNTEQGFSTDGADPSKLFNVAIDMDTPALPQSPFRDQGNSLMMITPAKKKKKKKKL